MTALIDVDKPEQCRPFHTYLGSTRVEVNEGTLRPDPAVFSGPEANYTTVRSNSNPIVSSSISSFADMG